MFRVAMICEGPADRAILEAVLDHYLEDYELLPIQPPKGALGGNAGPFGGGWKGVQAWCVSEVSADRRRWSALRQNTDLLIVQVDADVAAESENNRARPCPPPTDGADEVRALIFEWLDVQALPDQVVLCVPSMASETWALVALLPDHEANVSCDPVLNEGQCIECRTDIKSILRARSKNVGAKLVTQKQGKLKNHAPAYRRVQDRITQGWQGVVASCSEAARFDSDLEARIQLRM